MKILRSTLLAVSGLLGACASTESFSSRVMKPAPVDLGRYRLVAVERLEGEGSTELSDEITTALQCARNPLTGKADFEVLDRREVDRMLEDLRRRRTSTSDRETLALLDRWKNADVVIRGQVARHAVKDDVVGQEQIDRKTGHKHVQFVRTCRAQVAVTLEVLTADRDKPVDRVELDECASNSSTATDAEPPRLDHARLLASARQAVVRSYLARLLPHEETVTVRLQIDGDLGELQAGNGFARAGDWNEAARSYESALARAEGKLAASRWKALYNLGVAHMYTNRFDEARKALKGAYSLEQNESILQTLQSVAQREGEWQVLQEQRRHAPEPAR
jgi:hypothetical protein